MILIDIWMGPIWAQGYNLTKTGSQRNTDNLLVEAKFILETPRVYACELEREGDPKSKLWAFIWRETQAAPSNEHMHELGGGRNPVTAHWKNTADKNSQSSQM